jgi:hypothetical protein
MPMVGRADDFLKRRTVQRGTSRGEWWRWCCGTVLVLMLGVLFNGSELKRLELEGRNRRKTSTRIAPSGELKVRLSRTIDDPVSHACLCSNEELSQRRKKVVDVHDSLRRPRMLLDHILPNHLCRPGGRFAWPGTVFYQTLPGTDRMEGERYP